MPEEFSLEFPSQDSQQQPEIEPFESVATGFLKDVAEQDREIVQKYVKEWDSGVTKRFQALHDQYEPYKNLGPLEDIDAAVKLHSFLSENPREFYQRFGEAIQQLERDGLLDPFQDDQEYDEQDQQQDLGQQQPQTYNNDPALLSQLEEMRAAIEAVQGQQQSFQEQQEEAAGMQQLEAALENLHNTRGQFDDEYVLFKISQGQTPEQAFDSWNNMKNGILGTNRPSPTKLFGGGGHPGQPEVNLSDKKDRLAYIEAKIQAAQGR